MEVRVRKFAVLILLSAACFAPLDAEIVDAFSGSPAPPQAKVPSIIFSSLLASVSVDARTGRIKLGDLHATAVPANASGRAELLSPSGDPILHWTWSLDDFPLPPPYKLLAVKGPFKADGKPASYSETAINSPGKYAIDFYLGKDHFYTYRFSVRRSEPEDRATEEVLFLSDGAWDDWGYIYYADAKASKTLFWKIFLRDEHRRFDFHKINVRIVRVSDGKLICRSPEDKAYHLSHDWVRHDFFFYAAGSDATGTDYFRASDLIQKDGEYAIEMDFDGELYGRWLFEVKGRKIVRKDEPDTIGGDPLSVIDGGLDAWWLKRVSLESGGSSESVLARLTQLPSRPLPAFSLQPRASARGREFRP